MSDQHIGGKERPLLAAVVGSGPSGFYAAEALLKNPDLSVRVDMLDRLPTPFGLVRGGVAPDHGKIKSVTKVYEKIAALPGFRFFGNVKLGRDIQVEDLKRVYDVVIYAIGNETDRKLGVPGENLEGSRTATEFVAWYNGHPDYRDLEFDLSCENAAVVGIGNVAMDVTRILAKDPDSLAPTDIAEHAVAVLRKSKIKNIYVLGRRGPAQAAFSPKEIKEIGDDPAIELIVGPEGSQLDPLSKEFMEREADANQKKNVEYLAEVAKRGDSEGKTKVHLRLLVSPTELIGKDGRVAAVKIERNKLQKSGDGSLRPEGSGEFEEIPVGIIFRSVGYFGIPTPGVAFDEKKGRISNKEGRVTDPKTGEHLEGEYVVGWAKRGPSGLVGTNRACSVDTVGKILEDLKEGRVPAPGKGSEEEALALIASKQPKYVSFSDWQVLDRLELENGKAAGKDRLKFTRIEEMLAALEAAKEKAV